MKNKKVNAFLSTAAVTLIAYAAIDFYRTRYDRIFRAAAGESVYEKTHYKRK